MRSRLLCHALLLGILASLGLTAPARAANYTIQNGWVAGIRYCADRLATFSATEVCPSGNKILPVGAPASAGSFYYGSGYAYCYRGTWLPGPRWYGTTTDQTLVPERWPTSKQCVNPRAVRGQLGGRMPTTAKAGWTHVGGVDFATPAAAGKVASTAWEDRDGVYDSSILAYPDEWEGNSGGRYRFNANASVHDGILDVKVRQLDGEPSGAAWIWKHPSSPTDPHGFTYGAVEQRVRVVGDLTGYGSASLLWPDSNVWAEGEIDFPEGDFGKTTTAFHHCVGAPARNCSIFETRQTWTGWHTYRIEWTPSGTSYYIDGRLLGKNTTSTPRKPLHWVTQMALHQANARVGNRSGNYQVAWAKFDRLDRPNR